MSFGDTTTPNIKLTLVAPDRKNWADVGNNNSTILDAVVGTYFKINAIKGVWSNSFQYALGDVVVDSVDGSLWRCQVPHISPSVPITFIQARVLYASYWSIITPVPAYRGAWITKSLYNNNEFVFLNNIYYVCRIQHTSGIFATDLAAGDWEVFIDLTAAIAAQTAAGVSATAAAASATASATSATASATSATTATTQATAAAASATAAASGNFTSNVTITGAFGFVIAGAFGIFNNSGIAAAFRNAANSADINISAATIQSSGTVIIGNGAIINNTSTTLDFRDAANANYVIIRSNAMQTLAPSGSSSGVWKLGAANVVSPTAPNRTIAIDIGGTVYYLAAKTTND